MSKCNFYFEMEGVYGKNCNQERTSMEHVLQWDWIKYALTNILTNLCSEISTTRRAYVVIYKEIMVLILSCYNFAL
jgi:hypothetical protein